MQVEQFAKIDLDAYFKRISYQGDRTPTLSTLQAIHRHHAQAIAFENLNPLLQLPVNLDIATLQQKLIHEGRGGYCFEQNSLLREVLLALGFQVTNLAARVLWNRPEGSLAPRSHMLLQVSVEGEPHIADVGFGGLTLTTPLALTSGIEQQTSHEPFRLIKTEKFYILQAFINHEWKSLYQFDLQEQQLADYEVSNWYTSTYPNSLFVTMLLAARPDFEVRYALRNNQLTIHHLNGKTERHLLSTATELRTVLENRFGLQLGAIAHLDQKLQQALHQWSAPDLHP
ncbi:MAG: arylamine N-acetyltransferase [Oculatellaceae cyanobacterium Prado106]|nr:arylamine N-acetyltransferase [Oculatellaceae cyanobacterium Prado106]